MTQLTRKNCQNRRDQFLNFFPLRFRFTFQPTVIDILLIVPVLAWYQRQFAAPLPQIFFSNCVSDPRLPFFGCQGNSTDSMCSCLIFMNHLPRSFCLTIFVINFGGVLKFPARCLLQAHRATFRNQFPPCSNACQPNSCGIGKLCFAAKKRYSINFQHIELLRFS
ncbi:Uncharacterised protein [Shigella sonnei]|nr:Uncharacterised protein [Shigella sonnei]